MKLKTILSLLLAAVCIREGWLVAAQGPTNKDEQAIRAADTAWTQAVETKNLDKTVSFYSATATVMPFNGPAAKSPAEIRQLWAGLMAKPGFWLHFAPTKIEVSRARDIAYETGTFELKLNDDKGSPMSIPGKYAVVWERQQNGEWKAEVDIFNTDK